ncbi:RNA polymerase factor sigma-54 [Hippea sp. KM1]|uniref:RNA polymerase factor sigma-54 n=1 Tax=Hippea sp. KM1 TaxID=944481 RepID=UPI00046D23B7|nr:RNA polymerase factor sigma-54 [Hippea sp. KM1]
MIDLRTTLDTNLGLILTPRLDLSLKILSMNVVQIEQKIKELMTENPLIKLDEDVKVKKQPLIEDKFKEIEDSFRQHFDGEDAVSDIIEATVSDTQSIEDSLLMQLGFEMSLSDTDRAIAEGLIYNMDEKGFLSVKPEDIALNLGVGLERVELIRRQIMNLEPIGCCSLNTEEFLLHQASFEADSGMRERLEEFIKGLNNLTRPDLKRLKERLGWDDGLFEVVVERFKEFILYPLEYYNPEGSISYIEPDVFVKRVGSSLVAILNDRSLSGFGIDEEMLNLYLKDENANDFIKEKYRQAREFMVAISNRNKTLLKTVNVILQKQSRFFEDGTILPLTRKEVASILGFNVSTITRAVSNKYLEYRGSVFPLSKFFSSGVSEDVSKDYVKGLIRDMIEKEDKSNPLSDDQIRGMLSKKGIKLTRRTITKYRKEMNIPSSRERRCQNIL